MTAKINLSVRNQVACTNKRVNEIDVVKAIAIMLMVACHAGVAFAKFNQMFHMSTFLLLLVSFSGIHLLIHFNLRLKHMEKI